MTKSFDEWCKDNDHDSFAIGLEDAYKAGAQSRQAEVDELKQRIDEALIKLNDARNNGVDKSHYEAIKILKGNKDEHN